MFSDKDFRMLQVALGHIFYSSIFQVEILIAVINTLFLHCILCAWEYTYLFFLVSRSNNMNV